MKGWLISMGKQMYSICTYCKKEYTKTTSCYCSQIYCSQICTKAASKETAEFMKKTHEIGYLIQDFIMGGPKPYQEILRLVENKYHVTPIRAGLVVSSAFRKRFFLCYPRKHTGCVVYMRPSEIEKAQKIYVKMLNDSGVSKSLIIGKKLQHQKIARQICRLWDSGLSVPQIKKRTGYENQLIKECIGELNG